MKKTSIAITTAAIALLAVGGVSVMSALAQEKVEASSAQKAPRAKISPVEAIRIATAKIPGKALNANFEFDEGNWVYGVMIVHNHKISEVELDPMTGKVGDTEDVTPAGEAKEMQQELSAAIK